MKCCDRLAKPGSKSSKLRVRGHCVKIFGDLIAFARLFNALVSALSPHLLVIESNGTHYDLAEVDMERLRLWTFARAATDPRSEWSNCHGWTSPGHWLRNLWNRAGAHC